MSNTFVLDWGARNGGYILLDPDAVDNFVSVVIYHENKMGIATFLLVEWASDVAAKISIFPFTAKFSKTLIIHMSSIKVHPLPWFHASCR